MEQKEWIVWWLLASFTDATGIAHFMPFQTALQRKRHLSILLQLQENPNILFINGGCLPDAVLDLKVLIL